MSHEKKKDQGECKESRDRKLDRKPWVAPTVSESPVNDLTSATFVGLGADNAIYS